MYKIIKKKVLTPSIKLFEVFSPEVAAKAEPGQFIILRIDENGERIPLTIADFDRTRGTITIIFQEVGATTQLLGQLGVGDELLDFVGPLGKPSKIKKLDRVVCVGGGVGVAPVYPIARALKQAGNEVISIIGARKKDMLIYKDEMREISDQLFVVTDDGSAGTRGFVTDVLKEIVSSIKPISLVVAIGPLVMMKAAAETTRESGIHTVVSLNPIMVDGTGMCGACRVTVGEKTKFACVDGPEFDGHQVDWDLAMRRAVMFKDKETFALEHITKGGDCQCQNKK